THSPHPEIVQVTYNFALVARRQKVDKSVNDGVRHGWWCSNQVLIRRYSTLPKSIRIGRVISGGVCGLLDAYSILRTFSTFFERHPLEVRRPCPARVRRS